MAIPDGVVADLKARPFDPAGTDAPAASGREVAAPTAGGRGRDHPG